MSEFYDGGALLSKRDLNGRLPEVIMCVGNRTAGKTYYYKRHLVRRFLRHSDKFVVLRRFSYEVKGTAQGFFKDLGEIEWPRSSMTQRPLLGGQFSELLLDGVPCGYVIPMSMADAVKVNSSMFVDVSTMFLDEFQSETGKYAPNEIEKFQSIRISVGRGGGKHARFVRCILCANTVTLFNPYFNFYGISQRLQNRTRFLRGDNWVLEQTFNESAALALTELHTDMDSKHLSYAAGNKYLLDSEAFVERVPGQKSPLLTIVYEGRTYGVWEADYVIYVSEQYDPRWPIRVSYTLEDHGKTTQMMERASSVTKYLRKGYMDGRMRFSNGRAKHAALAIMALIPT